MRISSLRVNGFGIFHEQEVSALAPGLNIFLGDNEAGKSTLLGFIRAVLFGFPRANSRDPSYPPLAGGVHGGRIDVVTNSGRTFGVERRPGKGGGEVTVFGPEGGGGSEDTLQQLLAGITYEAFRNVYAFSLSELQTFESLRAESVKSVIYGATAGAAIMALPKAEKGLREALEVLFRSGGSKPTINRKLAELEDLAQRLREALVGAAEYDTNCSTLKEIDQQIAKLRQELSKALAQKGLLNRYLSVFPDFQQLQADEASLAALEEQVDTFPSEGLLRLEKEISQREHLETQRLESEQQLAHLQGKLSQLVVNTPVLLEAESVGMLLENRRDFIDKVNRLPVEERQRESLDESLSLGIAGLGADWSVAKVLAVDRSIFTRETILRHQEKQLRIEKDRASALELFSERERLLAEAVEAEREAAAYLTAAGEPPSAEEEEVLARLEQGRSEFASAVRDLPHRRIELDQERKNFSSSLSEIDPKWTEKEVLEFDLSLAARSTVVQFDDTLRSQEADLQEAKALMSAKEEAYRGISIRIEQVEARIAESVQPACASTEELEERKQEARSLAGCLKRKRDLDREIVHLRERIADKRAAMERVPAPVAGTGPFSRVFIILSAAGFILPLVLLLLGRVESAVIVLAACAVLAGSVYLGQRSSRPPVSAADEQSRNSLRRDVRELEDALVKAQEEQTGQVSTSIRSLIGRFGFEAGVTAEMVEKIEEDLETDRKLLSRREILLQNRAQLEEERGLCRADFERAEREVEKRMGALVATRREWTAFVESTGMRGALPPSVVNAVFSKIEAVRQRLEGVYSLERRIEKIQDVINEYRALAGRIPSANGHLPESHQDFASHVDRLLVERRAVKDRHSVALRSLEDKKRNLTHALRGREEAEKKLKKAEERMVEAGSAWREFLSDQGLPADLSPETAIEAFNRIDECIRQITTKNRLDSEIRSLREEIAGYEAEVLALHERLGRPAPATERIVPAVDQLIAEIDIQKKNAQSRTELETQVDDARIRLQTLQERIDGSNRRLEALLREAGAADTDDFRRRHGFHLQRTTLLTAISAAERRLRSLWREIELPQLKATLAALRAEEIPGEIRELEGLEGEIENQLEDLRRTRAEVCQRIMLLSSSDEVAQLRLEEERLLTELRESAMSWAKLAMAQHLIRKAKQIYEQQQQPKVVREAENFFRRITGGKYTQLFAPIGEESIEVVDAANTRRKPEELSRGTAEQLYLALRFGYIRSRAENVESLPIIMDDILVNFDPSRSRRAAEAILELASGQQVLFFTCHPETVDRFVNGGDNQVPIWEINQGRINRSHHSRAAVH